MPLLNRKEYEIGDFINSYYYYAEKQYRIDKYVFDWYIKDFNLIIEFNENSHKKKGYKNRDNEKILSIKENYNIFIINEKTALRDLAILVKKYPIW